MIMKRKGFLKTSCVALVLLLGIMPAFAGETSDEITTMLAWWDDVGSDWDAAKDVLELAVDEPVYELADSTSDTLDTSEEMDGIRQ
jgi:hypothetical protein